MCADATTTTELVQGLRTPLRKALGLSGMLLSATDPDTTVLSTAGVLENLPEAMCAPWMHNEFLEDDFNKFADLHRTEASVTTLHRATQGHPGLSPRHAQVNQPVGFGPELRTTFSHGGACWGVANLLRTSDDEDFEEEVLDWLERLRPTIADALRRSVMPALSRDGVAPVPGVVTLSPDGRVVSMSQSAEALLDDLWGFHITAGPEHRLPGEAYMVATLTRARARGRPQAVRPVTRLQGRSGQWLTVRGDYTVTGDGSLASIVLVVEPSRPTEIMPMVVASYGLSAREQEVVTEMAAGRTTKEIATRLFISEHTVRDHVKSILAKTGTASRGELLSDLFHHHAYPVSQFSYV